MWCGGVLYTAQIPIWRCNWDRLFIFLYTSVIFGILPAVNCFLDAIRACYGHFLHLHLRMAYKLLSISTSVYIVLNRQPNAGNEANGEMSEVEDL